jgi:pectate lyase
MRNFTVFVLLFIAFFTSAQSVTITESTGWLESVFVKWLPVSGASSYNVYFSGNGITDRKIDTQLIRSYGTYFRADVVGIAAGTYTIKICPVISGVEATGSTTANITVLAHDRTGFAFHGGRVPGAYKADGTPKDGAVIIYITKNTKNTVSLNITGASANPCVGLQNILYGIKKGKDTRPFIIRLIGDITDMTVMEGGDITIENAQNTASYLTLEGIGSDAVVNGMGIRLKSATNIEVRNLGTMNCNSTAGDNIGLQQDNDHIWVHNCDLYYGNAGSDADQIKGDGALDNKGSTYITFSYNHFWDSGKASLLGLSEGGPAGLYITYHHNWFDHSDSRHPRVRFYSTHVYNNYYDGNAKYGIGSTLGSSVFVENNVFRNCKYPMLTSKQGTDIFYDATGTFSGEAGGTIKAFNNVMSGQTRYVPYNATTYPGEFDAIEATTRDQLINSAIKSKLGGNSYNNFDTDASFYIKTLVPDEPEVAKTKLMTYAGRVEGGDLKWTFNNAVDDASYDVHTGLKAALTNYTTALVAVQGETTVVVSSQTLVSETDINQAVESGTPIEPMIFTWGGDATNAAVTGLPASGISFVKDATAKTITILGTPTGNVSFTVTTSGSAGTPASLSGTITLGTVVEPPVGDIIHNFTVSGKTSTFFAITGNMNSTNGSVSYAGLTLTSRMKIESSTSIIFTTSQPGTLTLVFDATFTGTIKVDGVAYNAVAGIATINISAGSHTITKGDIANLFYIKIANSATNGLKNPSADAVRIYPNPVRSNMTVIANAKITKVEIYSLTGILLNSTENQNSIDVSELRSGNYLVKIYTTEGFSTQQLIKE